MSDFTELLEAQIPRLRRYARALVHEPNGADDLVQDTLVRALAKQHRWQAGTNLRAWLFTLMHNQFVNNVRRFNRASTMVDVDEVSSTLVAVADPTSSCQMRELDQALARLPVEQREVLLLVGLEGVRYDEAAEILRVPIGTVRSRLFRGRESLRRLLGMDEEAAANIPPAQAAMARRRQSIDGVHRST